MTGHVVIVGGGASGTLMAAHLLTSGGRDFRATLIERGGRPGTGIAYSTSEPSHLLNTRVQNMSAFAEKPDHFRAWLAAHGHCADGQGFVRRDIYGRYMSDLLSVPGARLNVVHAECVSVRPLEAGVEARLADGSAIAGHFAVLATGHALVDENGVLANPWTAPLPEDLNAQVLLIGSGLTMVDRTLSLLDAGHRGGIIALSRRGLLPQPHAQTVPLRLSLADLPMGTSLAYATHRLRRLIRDHEAAGGDWRDVVDGVRPHIKEMWRHLPEDSRRRFLHHAATWWETHRHRMPPQSSERIAGAIRSGALRIEKGRFIDARRTGRGFVARYGPPGGDRVREIEAGQIVDCRGIRHCPEASADRLIRSLVDNGDARFDPLMLGLDFSPEAELVDAGGRPSGRIFGIGPVTRSAFWEITAVPDIREQAARLAAHLERR